MSKEDESLIDLVDEKFKSQNKRLNLVILTMITVFLTISSLGITFMVSQSKDSGSTAEKLKNIVTTQETTQNQLNELTKIVSNMATKTEVHLVEFNTLKATSENTFNMAKRTEMAVLTDDISIITRNAKNKQDKL